MEIDFGTQRRPTLASKWRPDGVQTPFGLQVAVGIVSAADFDSKTPGILNGFEHMFDHSPRSFFGFIWKEYGLKLSMVLK